MSDKVTVSELAANVDECLPTSIPRCSGKLEKNIDVSCQACREQAIIEAYENTYGKGEGRK